MRRVAVEDMAFCANATNNFLPSDILSLDSQRSSVVYPRVPSTILTVVPHEQWLRRQVLRDIFLVHLADDSLSPSFLVSGALHSVSFLVVHGSPYAANCPHLTFRNGKLMRHSGQLQDFL